MVFILTLVIRVEKYVRRNTDNCTNKHKQRKKFQKLEIKNNTSSKVFKVRILTFA